MDHYGGFVENISGCIIINLNKFNVYIYIYAYNHIYIYAYIHSHNGCEYGCASSIDILGSHMQFLMDQV